MINPNRGGLVTVPRGVPTVAVAKLVGVQAPSIVETMAGNGNFWQCRQTSSRWTHLPTFEHVRTNKSRQTSTAKRTGIAALATYDVVGEIVPTATVAGEAGCVDDDDKYPNQPYSGGYQACTGTRFYGKFVSVRCILFLCKFLGFTPATSIQPIMAKSDNFNSGTPLLSCRTWTRIHVALSSW